MQDFNKLAASKKIEDKLKAVQDPACPGEVISILINNNDILWDTRDGQKLINTIVSHPKTDLVALMSIFSYYGSTVLSKLTEEESLKQRKLIMQNRNWDLDEIISILSDKIEKTADGDEKCFMVGSITDVDVLDEESEKKIYDKLSKKVNSIYCLCEWARKVMKMGDRVLAEALLNQAPKIPSDLCDYWDYKILAETTIAFMADINKEQDAYNAASAIYDMAISKTENIDQWNALFERTEYEPLKIAVLKNPSCPKEILQETLKGDNDNLKKVVKEKLKPAGFGRYADPDTGEVIAKMQDGTLVPV